MRYPYFSNSEIVSFSRNMIHLFLNKQTEEFMEHVSEDFVWIGDYDALYMQGAEKFAASIHTESKMPPVVITNEEYALLTHERSLSVTYGRCVVQTSFPDGSSLNTKFHFTFTWKRFGSELKLIHAMACHIPDAQEAKELRVRDSQVFGKITAYQKRMLFEGEGEQKLVFQSSDGNTYYLYSSEILYIQACGNSCMVHTAELSFTCYRQLKTIVSPALYRVSKSFLVNRQYVSRLERFQITLTDGTLIPVSRPLYMELKKLLGEA